MDQAFEYLAERLQWAEVIHDENGNNTNFQECCVTAVTGLQSIVQPCKDAYPS